MAIDLKPANEAGLETTDRRDEAKTFSVEKLHKYAARLGADNDSLPAAVVLRGDVDVLTLEQAYARVRRLSHDPLP